MSDYIVSDYGIILEGKLVPDEVDASVWPAYGEAIYYLDANGYESEREYARRFMKRSDALTVERIHVGRSSASYVFREFPNQRFNTVMFTGRRLETLNQEKDQPPRATFEQFAEILTAWHAQKAKGDISVSEAYALLRALWPKLHFHLNHTGLRLYVSWESGEHDVLFYLNRYGRRVIDPQRLRIAYVAICAIHQELTDVDPT